MASTKKPLWTLFGSRTDVRQVHRVLAVVAHPDDESFGLGAVLDRLVRDGNEVSLPKPRRCTAVQMTWP